MLQFIKNRKRSQVFYAGITTLLFASVTLAVFCNGSYAAGAKRGPLQKSYTSPEEAVKALVAAVRANDENELLALLGPEGKQIISSGDAVADKEGQERFVSTYEQRNKLVQVSETKAVLEVGNDRWPLPIPIVKSGANWRFDTRQGKEEMLNRRIGKNELSTIQVCLAYVDAQREYASKDRHGDGILEYAQKFLSTPGKKDGLYWETTEGEEQSPLGPFAAQARTEGYTKKKPGDKPSPYHGYFYKILKAQGKNAPRGAYDYVSQGRMVGGFAMVAYPAGYGSSGIMTFIVSHDGVVYQKDLGKKTASIARAIKTFDPDKTWKRVEGKNLELPGKEGGTE